MPKPTGSPGLQAGEHVTLSDLEAAAGAKDSLCSLWRLRKAIEADGAIEISTTRFYESVVVPAISKSVMLGYIDESIAMMEAKLRGMGITFSREELAKEIADEDENEVGF